MCLDINISQQKLYKLLAKTVAIVLFETYESYVHSNNVLIVTQLCLYTQHNGNEKYFTFRNTL